MGRRGPVPQPTQLKILRGNPAKDKIEPEREPQPKTGKPTKPSWINGEGQKLWTDVCKRLDGMGLLHKSDGEAIAGFVRCCVRLKELQKTITDQGSYYETYTDNGSIIRRHPAVTDEQLMLRHMLTFARELGLTPSARGGMTVDKPSELDDFEQFLSEAK